MRFKSTSIFFVLFICVLIPPTNLTPSINYNFSPVDAKTSSNDISPHSDLIQSGPIRISSNQDLVDQGFPGSGTSEDPYVISGYSFSGNEDLIGITDSDASVLITNNVFRDSPLWGVFADRVENVVIKNNTFLNLEVDAVGLYHSSNSIVTNNTMVNVSVGVRLEISDHNIVTHNNITNVNEGGVLMISGADSNIVEYNTITGGADQGISISAQDESNLGGSKNVIRYNDIRGARYNGIEINYHSQFNTVEHNSIRDAGISLNGEEISGNKRLNGNLIQYNSIIGASEVGIHLSHVFNVTIAYNNVSGSGAQGIWAGNSQQLHVISNLVVRNNPDSSINLYHGNSSIISYNVIADNRGIGVLLENSDHNLISDNIIVDNGESGIEFHQSRDNNITRNNLGGNLDHFDIGNINNSIHSNYFKESVHQLDVSPASHPTHLVEPEVVFYKSENDTEEFYNVTIEPEDISFSYIGLEISYMLEYSVDLGETWMESDLNNESWTLIDLSDHPDLKLVMIRISITDNYGFSLVVEDYPDEMLEDRFITPPEFLTPTTAELPEIVEISWTHARDSFGKEFRYALQYKVQGTEEWITIISNLDQNHTTWNTTGLDGGNYLLRIVSTDFLNIEYITVAPEIFVIEENRIQTLPRIVNYPIELMLVIFALPLVYRRKKNMSPIS